MIRRTFLIPKAVGQPSFVSVSPGGLTATFLIGGNSFLRQRKRMPRSPTPSGLKAKFRSESSGTAFFCFGLAWGINRHILDRREFLPATEKAYAALADAVGPEGKVQWGQLVDSKPNPAQRESTHEYVTGAFLLAASEVYKLSPNENRK